MEKRVLGNVMWVVVGLAPALFPVAAWGTATPATANIIQIEATSGGHTATFQEVFPVASFDGVLNWSLPAPLALEDGGVSLGTIQNLQVSFNADPQVDLAFAVLNSNLAAVNFNISTATIIFDPVPNAQAAAAASLTLTQGAGSAPGATLTGLFPGGKAYEARYSTDGIINTSTLFAALGPSLSFVSGLGTSQSEMLPAAGMVNLGTTVHMMESEFKFTLSPGDQASGTSAFIIVPEPATLAFCGLGGLLALRRRRTA